MRKNLNLQCKDYKIIFLFRLLVQPGWDCLPAMMKEGKLMLFTVFILIKLHRCNIKKISSRRLLNKTSLYRLQFYMRAKHVNEFRNSRRNLTSYILIRHPIHRQILHFHPCCIMYNKQSWALATTVASIWPCFKVKQNVDCFSVFKCHRILYKLSR